MPTPETFQCRQCGTCCRWPGFVRLEAGDPAAIAAFLGISSGDFIDRYATIAPNRAGLALADRAGSDACIFLTPQNRCAIYPVRPRQCRTFPFEWSVPGCPALEDAPQKPIRAIALGQFDGVHRGHAAVFAAARAEAARLGGASAALTFAPHVADVLFPGHPPLRLSTADETARLIRATGIDSVLTWPFDATLAALPPADFLRRLRQECPGLQAVVAGTDYTFGARRAGTPDTFDRNAREADPENPLRALFVPPVLRDDGQKISSTLVRQCLREGDVPAAADLLGRPYRLAGPVIHGRAVGRTRGLPTANVRPPAELLRPAPGVYAVSVQLPGETALRPAAAFLPDAADPRQALYAAPVEVHIPGFSGDLYGQTLPVLFRRRIRPFRPFASKADAIAQVRADLAAI